MGSESALGLRLKKPPGQGGDVRMKKQNEDDLEGAKLWVKGLSLFQ